MSDYKMWIPYLNRPDLLDTAVRSSEAYGSNRIIIDNSPEGLPTDTWMHWHGVYVLRPLVPLSCPQTFNYIMRTTQEQGANICIWMHNDAEPHPGVCEELLKIARQSNLQGRKWGVLWTHYDTLSAINTDLLSAGVEWDTTFWQYFCDNDFYRRVRLAGYECIDTGLQVNHPGSQTINSDPAIKLKNNATFMLYRDYYIRKWGGEPGHEAFTTPFGV